jgi:hypothetical protein
LFYVDCLYDSLSTQHTNRNKAIQTNHKQYQIWVKIKINDLKSLGYYRYNNNNRNLVNIIFLVILFLFICEIWCLEFFTSSIVMILYNKMLSCLLVVLYLLSNNAVVQHKHSIIEMIKLYSLIKQRGKSSYHCYWIS